MSAGKKKGGTNRKFGRNGRANTNATQEQRSARNKRRAIERDAKAKIDAKRKQDKDFAKGKVTCHGAARHERRAKAAFVTKMAAAKARKQAQRTLAEAASRGGSIIALPDQQSLAIVAAWAKAKAFRQTVKQRRADQLMMLAVELGE